MRYVWITHRSSWLSRLTPTRWVGTPKASSNICATAHARSPSVSVPNACGRVLCRRNSLRFIAIHTMPDRPGHCQPLGAPPDVSLWHPTRDTTGRGSTWRDPVAWCYGAVSVGVGAAEEILRAHKDLA